MKFIDFIVNPAGGILTDGLTRKSERIKRNIEQGVAAIQDEIDEIKEKKVTALRSLGDVADASSTSKMAEVFSKICTYEEEIALKNRCIEYLKGVRTELDKDVDVTTNPTVVKIEQ